MSPRSMTAGLLVLGLGALLTQAGCESEIPSCTDGVKNGSETDLDCGGSCSTCQDGKGCLAGTDCASGSCAGEKCDPSCGTGNGGCDVNATCANLAAARTCTCNAGWTGSGFTCDDVDECQANNGGCSRGATCTNTPGSRTCACPEGAEDDGTHCVVGGRYALDLDTVNDASTGLTWQRAVPASTYTWDEAAALCQSLDLGGLASGWRLPTQDELSGIVDDGFSPRIDPTAFPETPSDYFWTSTNTGGAPGQACCIYFRIGASIYFDTSRASKVRCVR